jgi:hypothetical protein
MMIKHGCPKIPEKFNLQVRIQPGCDKMGKVNPASKDNNINIFLVVAPKQKVSHKSSDDKSPETVFSGYFRGGLKDGMV